MKKITMRNVPEVAVDMVGGFMTGAQVYRQALLDPDDSSNFNLFILNFAAGSRNKFHTHSDDQILIITEGTGKVASDAEELTVSEGDVVLIPAGENHWHGAPDATSMAHITINVAGTQSTQTEA